MKNPELSDLISAFCAETTPGAITPNGLGSLLQKIVDAVPSLDTGGLSQDVIVADFNDGSLILRGHVKQLLAAGFKPYLFRYSKKRPRYTIRNSSDRVYGPRVRGWNRFFSSGKVSVQPDGKVIFYGHHGENINIFETGTGPQMLFGSYILDIRQGNCTSLRVPFGQRMVECKRGHRFAFAIGFAPEQKEAKFDFSTLVSNLAIFHVFVKFDEETDKPAFFYSL